METIDSKIKAAEEKVSSLLQQIDEAQRSKRNGTFQSCLASMEWQPAAVRCPPAIKVRRTLKGHFAKVTAMHWGGDSRTVVSASQDGNLLVWNAVTAHKVQAIPLKSSYVMCVGIEQTRGNLIACGGLDNLCTVYNRSTPPQQSSSSNNNNASMVEMAAHDGFLSCCRFLSEKEIVSSSGDSTCIHWDIEHAKPISTMAEHTSDALFLHVKPDDRNIFVSCSVDKTAKIWDVRSTTHSVQTHGGHLADVTGVEFMPSDGQCFATCCEDGAVRIFDIRAYNELARFGTAVTPTLMVSTSNEGFTSLSFSSSGRLVYCGHCDGSVYAYDVLSDRGLAFVLQGAHERNVSCVGVAPQGNALCTGSWDSNLKVWA